MAEVVVTCVLPPATCVTGRRRTGLGIHSGNLDVLAVTVAAATPGHQQVAICDGQPLIWAHIRSHVLSRSCLLGQAEAHVHVPSLKA